MVRTSSQDDSAAAGLFQIVQGLFSLSANVVSTMAHFFPRCMGSCLYFFGRKIGKFFHKACDNRFFIGKRKKRIMETNGWVIELINVVFNIFRIGSNDRTVVMVDRIFKLCPFIRNTRIENIVYALFDQPGHMTMGQFCRIAFGFTGNGFDSKFINLSGRSR